MKIQQRQKGSKAPVERWKLLKGACAKSRRTIKQKGACKAMKIANRWKLQDAEDEKATQGGWGPPRCDQADLGHTSTTFTLWFSRGKRGCYASVKGPAMLMAAMGRVTTSLGIPKRLFRRPEAEACQTSRNPKEKVNARPKDKAKKGSL